MSFKRRVLAVLTRDELLDIGVGLELDVSTVMRKDDVLDVLARSDAARLGAILADLSRDSLKGICEAVGLPADGKEKQPIIARILAASGPGAGAGTGKGAGVGAGVGRGAGASAGAGVDFALSHATPAAPKPAKRGGGDGAGAGKKKRAGSPTAESYQHVEAKVAMRPEVGTQAQFRKKKEPTTYRYDSSLSPALNWDGQNAARERGERLIRQILDAGSLDQAKAAASELRALGKPFLDWAGKAERLSFEVPTLPLFVHERLSTRAILDTLKPHKADKQQSLFDLFGDPKHSVSDQILRAYEHKDDWVNRMILGDSLVVMNSLLRYEALGGQVQMIYMDPPYGVKFGSNFQPFVRKRDVSHGDDQDLTREPEMVQAYRDTWELGLHSYLTYMRDRLLLCRELLAPSGSVFVQISDENVHHVRELMDEVFGAENFISLVTFKKTTSASASLLASVSDYLVWYARDRERMKYRQLFQEKQAGEAGATQYTWAELPDGARVNFGSPDRVRTAAAGSRIFAHDNLTSQRPAQGADVRSFRFDGRDFSPGKGTFKTDLRGLENLARAKRLMALGDTLRYVRFLDDFRCFPIANTWEDTVISGFAESKLYVVQTMPAVAQRCLLMTTDPGDLVLDPTCGSGTTAYAAERWGRRWITADVSRVPLALARQRLLTATYDWHELQDDKRGPAGGFVYKRKQNVRGEEVGGIVPHITLGSIANDEPPEEEVLVDRPEKRTDIVRVTGPFTFEATIPTPVDIDGDGVLDTTAKLSEDHGSFVERMIEVLRHSPLLRLPQNRTVSFGNIRPPAKTLSLSAEAVVKNGADKPVAIVFGPENGAVSEKLVFEAAKEAGAKRYGHLYVFGFAIQPNARKLVDDCEEVAGIPATYVQATPDLLMGDLLKNMRSSQIFSVCGLPEVDVRKIKPKSKTDALAFEVELLGIDSFDPVTMQNESKDGADAPAWFLDADYNGLCFKVSQAFFPKTGAWESLKKALKADYEESVFEHLAGTTSAPFEPGEHNRISVKVIDERGNELMVVRDLV